LAERVLLLDSYTGVADDMLRGARDGYVNARRIDADHFLRVIVEPAR
jgi:hypothetical protein